jgi:oligosaccharide repeat unit polymerase
MILLADMLLPYPKKKFQFLNRISGKNVRLLFLCLVVAVTILMLCLNKNYDVINGLISAIRNTYEVRAKAAGKIHWLFLGMEYWAAYYSIIMITFYLSKKRWFIVFLLMLIVLCFFTIQANRVMLFFLGIALIAGMMKKIDNRHIAGGLLIVSLLIFIEVLIAPDNGKIATSFFTRFSVIPNRLGENYYDYFLKNEPDYFRLHFPRLMKLMGLSSPYSNPSIGNLIGREFYSRTMNANTGLFGSAMLNFGVIGSLVEPILVVLLLRLIDKVTIGVGTYSMKLMISIVMTTLLINLPSALISAIMPVSYLCWLLMSLVLASRSDDVTSY